MHRASARLWRYRGMKAVDLDKLGVVDGDCPFHVRPRHEGWAWLKCSVQVAQFMAVLAPRVPRLEPRSMSCLLPAQAEGCQPRCLGCRLRSRINTTMSRDLCFPMPQGARLKPSRFAFSFCLAAGSPFWHPPRPNPLQGLPDKSTPPFVFHARLHFNCTDEA